MTSSAESGLTILENWILDRLERADTLTPTALAAQLAIPRPMIVEALIGLADRGLIEDGTDKAQFIPDGDDDGMAEELSA